MKKYDEVLIGQRRCIIASVIDETHFKVVYKSDKGEPLMDDAQLVEGKLQFSNPSPFSSDRVPGGALYEHAVSLLMRPEIWANIEHKKRLNEKDT